jgi:hypothetical protein
VSCCAGCVPGDRVHTITGADGRSWHFEETFFCGPFLLRKDGEPKARQPGSRSLFWPAYQAWLDSRGTPPQQPAV